MVEKISLAYNAAMTVMENEHPGIRDAKTFLPDKMKKKLSSQGTFLILYATVPFPGDRHRAEYGDQSLQDQNHAA